MNNFKKKLIFISLLIYGAFASASTVLGDGSLMVMFKADKKYQEGDVLSIGGEREVTLYDVEMPLAGVVSSIESERVDMGNEEFYYETYIVLAGRAKIKINGSATKGTFIIADRDGKGRPIAKEDFLQNSYKGNSTNIIGISLEDEIDEIEVKI